MFFLQNEFFISIYQRLWDKFYKKLSPDYEIIHSEIKSFIWGYALKLDHSLILHIIITDEWNFKRFSQVEDVWILDKLEILPTKSSFILLI
ncbi:unnamed protein product [Rhizophagus irregularis]|nr:unnamed protein product [Rhizophagus irregularis]CAB4437834.1 unnamed protein product [Rhizophagus irregularis]